MKVTVNMTVDEQKLEVGTWWASSPEFAIKAFQAQIEAARVIWPEAFGGVVLTIPASTSTPNR